MIPPRPPASGSPLTARKAGTFDLRRAGPADRAARVERFATRHVDLHHWQVRPTADRYGLAVEHGEYAVSVMFGKRVTAYVENGASGRD